MPVLYDQQARDTLFLEVLIHGHGRFPEFDFDVAQIDSFIRKRMYRTTRFNASRIKDLVRVSKTGYLLFRRPEQYVVRRTKVLLVIGRIYVRRLRIGDECVTAEQIQTK